MSDPFSPTVPEIRAAGMDRRLVRSRWSRHRRWLLPALAAAAACFIAVAAFELVPASGTLSVPSDEITVAIAADAPFQDYLPVRANVAPRQTVFVGAIEGGTVERVAVLDGVSVKAGDILATLSNPQLRLDVTSREAAIAGQLGSVSAERLGLQQNLTAADSAIAETRYDLLKAQRELAIRRRLQQQGFESAAGVESFADEAHYYASRLAAQAAAAQRDQATADRQADAIDQTTARLQNNLSVVEGSLRSLTLSAPVSGRLTNFLLQPGQSLKQGDQIGQIDSEGAWRLDADIDEFYLGRVLVGQRVTADFDGATASLTVSRVIPQVTSGQFRAEFTFDTAPPGGLRRGQSVEGRITLGDTRPALLLPNGPWLQDSGGNFAFVLDPSGHHAIRQAISSGRRNPDQVEITAGLEPGARVVTSSYSRFANFSRLLVH